ncbi:MAG: ExeM/NucH family extracellular endonuclease [Kocuria sp.]|uniref:ExeM/NucH family extracellular endonuclease n=1 Tax=Kocuria sp. TaxID=1871328 RepID=UPI0026DDCBDF|nr:ExeM/NucH family extracellular endonuclease [Kocuria sp.]MDO4255865.1 ExeM/NucH family extracellular endonuclease [Kocuria sp.]
MPTPHPSAPADAVRRGALAISLSAALLTTGLGATPAIAAPSTTSIATIQGTGQSTPLAGQTVTTEPAVVTAVYPSGPGSLGGFVIQTPGSGGTITGTTASTGLFVHTGQAPVTVQRGDAVQVTGTAGEYQGLTQLSGTVSVKKVVKKVAPVKPVTTDWASTASYRENLESMVYQPRENFRVADTYGVGRYGELGLSAGKELPAQPTQVARPNSPEARAQAQRNDAISVTLDDGTNRGFAASPTQEPRQVPYLTPENPVAVGDTARITAPVIVDYRFDKWRLQPTTPMVPGKEPARFSGSADPKPGVGGQVRIASFNVLNYFTTVGQDKGCRGGNYSTDGTYNVAQGCDARGAYDRADFERQQAKTVSVINKVDASVVGLMEVENSAKLGEPKDEALASLVKALNKAAGYTKWAYVPVADSELQPVAEQDFITNAIVYQPREVTQVGQARALGSEAVAGGAFENARTPIAATFTATKGGGKHGAAPTTVVVNHFKSKGSAPRTGPNRDTGDGQGAWNTSRVAQASAVVDWIPELTAAAGSQDVAVLGDFNSYAQEDPLQEFYRAGYARAAEDDYTYVFGGQVGSLDHMLISPSLAKRMTGAAAWNINSGQSPLLQYAQYRTTALDYYVPNEVASSDHDPFIAGFRAGTK